MQMVAGEDDAYRLFTEKFGIFLGNFFWWKGLASTDAKDLAVSCVSDIAVKIKQYRRRGKGNFEGWVFRIARNKYVDWVREQHRCVPLREEFTTEIITGPIKPNIEMVAAVQEALDQLSEAARQIIILKDLDGERCYEEVAKLLHISNGAARVRHLRALKSLERILEQDPRIIRILNNRRGTSNGTQA